MAIEFDAKNTVITPEAVLIIGTYDENGVPNAMNAAWGTQTDFSEITISLSQHKTTDNIEKTGAFTVAFGTVDTVTISDYFGVETGRKINKIAQQADESVITDGKIDLDKLKPIIYDSSIHAYRSVGPVIATAFSEGFKIKKAVEKWDN